MAMGRSGCEIAAGVAAAGALLATGALVMGAVRVPATREVTAAEAQAEMARLFPTPRLYRVTMSGTMLPPREGMQICLGAELLRTLVRDAQQTPPAGAASPPAGGCKMTHEKHADGAFRTERTCDQAAGAAATSHMVMEGQAKDFRLHTERVVDSVASDAPRIVAMDMHMADAGACPATMKPGQVRAPNGAISELPATPGAVGASGAPARR